MTAALRVLGLDDTKWERVGPASLWSATTIVVATSGLMALNRFGGTVLSSPRSYVRLALVVVWGWIGLALAVWLVARHAPVRPIRADAEASPVSFCHALAAIGRAHTPLLALAIVVFVAAGVLDVLGPGSVAAVFVFGFWFPSAVAMATRHAFGFSLPGSLMTVAVPYALWLLVIGRHLLGQVQHLL